MTNTSFDYAKMNVKRMGLKVLVRAWEYSENDYSTISTIRSIDKIDGKLVSEMTDNEILSAWSLTSKNFSH